jgi:uncharacterized DUF497 family protein
MRKATKQEVEDVMNKLTSDDRELRLAIEHGILLRTISKAFKNSILMHVGKRAYPTELRFSYIDNIIVIADYDTLNIPSTAHDSPRADYYPEAKGRSFGGELFQKDNDGQSYYGGLAIQCPISGKMLGFKKDDDVAAFCNKMHIWPNGQIAGGSYHSSGLWFIHAEESEYMNIFKMPKYCPVVYKRAEGMSTRLKFAESHKYDLNGKKNLFDMLKKSGLFWEKQIVKIEDLKKYAEKRLKRKGILKREQLFFSAIQNAKTLSKSICMMINQGKLKGAL